MKRPRPSLLHNRIDKWYSEAWKYESQLDESGYFALLDLEQYVNGLIVEWNRLLDDRSRLSVHWWGKNLINENLDLPESFFETNMALYLDTHFYLICWDSVKKNFEALVHQARKRRIGLAYRSVKTLLRDASRARDFYEHAPDWGNRNHVVGIGGISSITGKDDTFSVTYPPKGTKPGQKFSAEWVELGRPEVLRITKAYERVLKAFESLT